VPGKVRRSEAHRSGGATARRFGVAARRRRAPLVGDELWWVLQHEGGTRSEEGLMAEDDDGWRWK
jgi:hypothetical protein